MTQELTKEMANDIAILLNQYKTVGDTYINKGHSLIDYENIIMVDNEIKRIINKLLDFKNGITIISYENDSPIFYKYTTDEDLYLQVNSELLDVELVWNNFKPEEV